MTKVSTVTKCMYCRYNAKVVVDACNYTKFKCAQKHFMIQCKACGWMEGIKDEHDIPQHCSSCPCIFWLPKPTYDTPASMKNPLGEQHMKSFVTPPSCVKKVWKKRGKKK